jgi:2',3'-cyclic-nucleotide 2'-phosphodiesterase (5'-nucleotidase family)
MARWASLIKQRRSETPVLLIDAGDFCPAQRTKNQEVKDRYFFEGMRLLGYDAIGVGENEIRFGRKRLLETMRDANLPLVSTNIIDKRGNGHLVSPTRIVTVGGRRVLLWRTGGVRVGVLSVVLPAYVHKVDEMAGRFYEVRDPQDTALEAASALRKSGCDLVIALSQLGWQNSLELARTVPGIDIVVNGHRSHNGMYYERVGRTLVLDTGINRSSFAEIDVSWKDGAPRFSAKEMGKVLLSLQGDPALVELEKDYQHEIERLGIHSDEE